MSFLSSISNEEISVSSYHSLVYAVHLNLFVAQISRLALNCTIVVSNCSKDKDFGFLYVPPGMIDWATILSAWIESPYAPLRFNAKSIAANVIHVLDADNVFLLELSDDEVESLVEMISECTFSESLTAKGFDCQFQANEVVELVSSLVISPHNISRFAMSSAVLISLLQLLRREDCHVKKCTCRLLLQLCCYSSSLRKEAGDLNIKEALFEEMSEMSNDSTFMFLSRSLLLALDKKTGVSVIVEHMCMY